ncbi:MAG TPA: hypothetical protein VKB71_14625 [Rhizomicrobium sp.]|nr:hypothetical protein [Rhizomicrobium sp.]
MSAKIWVMAAVSAAASLALAAPSLAADAKGEITIAAQHASLASQATDISGVRMHLHHTLNCLEGPNGADYSKKDMNPCEHAGAGAIPDSSNPTTTATLQSAVGEAVKGLGASDLKTAQGDASATAATLQAIK